jgi:hypothetical protein
VLFTPKICIKMFKILVRMKTVFQDWEKNFNGKLVRFEVLTGMKMIQVSRSFCHVNWYMNSIVSEETISINVIQLYKTFLLLSCWSFQGISYFMAIQTLLHCFF